MRVGLAGLLGFVGLIGLLACGAAAHEEELGTDQHGGQADTVPLYDNLGTHHRPISTDVEATQAYFDQGLRLQYAFNHAEAIRSYEEALRHDPSCAMCWWGIALASGPNLNAPMDVEGGRRAYAAILEARELAPGAPEDERALIEALARRYDADPETDRASLDAAYADAVGQLAARFPDDADILTLYAAARMNLSPSNYWSGEYGARTPNEGTPEILDALRTALELNPDNPGACHYHIHSVEAAHPEWAVDCADRLAALMPGAGHIVHMPGHIYSRVGRYADAVRTNEHAVHADETYIADRQPTGLYPSAYYPHNYHFMWFAASMAGMSEKAMAAAQTVAPKVPVEVARQTYWVQTVMVLPELAAIVFGRWHEALAAPPPPAELLIATAMHEYAQGVAFAALGDSDEAEAVLTEVRQLAERISAEDADSVLSTPHASSLTDTAVHMLSGQIALRAERADEAVTHFRAASEIEDRMLAEEPPLWFFPVRHALGRALLEAERPVEAEAEYRSELARFPENGWSLYGLARALEAQGKKTEAAAVWSRFNEAWQHADVELPAATF